MATEPVKAIFRISMWEESAAPAVGPRPQTMLRTPGGKPASRDREASFWSERGASSGDLMMRVLPRARAGPIFQVAIMLGG